MRRHSEQLECEAEIARGELANSLEELRARMTLGQVVEELVEYARDTPVAEFMRNLSRDIRNSPLPVLVIFAGIAWAAIASALAQRRANARPALPNTAGLDAGGARVTSVPLRQPWEVAPVCETVE
jgi:hypothetical protein